MVVKALRHHLHRKHLLHFVTEVVDDLHTDFAAHLVEASFASNAGDVLQCVQATSCVKIELFTADYLVPFAAGGFNAESSSFCAGACQIVW